MSACYPDVGGFFYCLSVVFWLKELSHPARSPSYEPTGAIVRFANFRLRALTQAIA
ncbi:hypothetical protein OKW41_007513 [Paraburkholderia sp. UCT70]